MLNKVDAVAIARIIGQWLAQQEVGALAQLAIVGKVLRGSGRHDGKPLQLLSAVTQHLRLTLDQVAIEEKSNEIPALKPLLKKLKLPPGTLITPYAMHCQQETARFITQGLDGDYLFGLKSNQSGILNKAQHLLAHQGFSSDGLLEKEHGRFDRRSLARVAVTPEQIGLTGFLAGHRRGALFPKTPSTQEIGLFGNRLLCHQPRLPGAGRAILDGGHPQPLIGYRKRHSLPP